MAETFDPYGLMAVDFAGTRYAGAVVTMRIDLPIAETMEVWDLLFGPVPDGTSRGLQDLARVFGERLLDSWNLTDPKTKKGIPATAEGALKAPPALIRACLSQWQTRVFDPSLPLEQPSAAT